MALYLGSNRDLCRAAGLTSEGLKKLESQFKAEIKARREQFRREAQLHERVFEPLGRLLDQPPTRAALQELFELDKAARLLGEPPTGAGGRLRPPLQINTQPGSTVTVPPLDGAWTDPQSNGTVSADKDAGTVLVALSADKDNQNAYGATGVELWVVPQSADKVLVLNPHLHVHYSAKVHTEAGPTAHTDGYLNVLIKAHDGFPGNVIDSLTQDSRSQLWSAGSSGWHDDPPAIEADYESNLSFVVRGGAWYEVWFWIQSIGDAGSNFFGGWSSSLSSLNVRVDLVEAIQS
jgi:hypothetical protein